MEEERKHYNHCNAECSVKSFVKSNFCKTFFFLNVTDIADIVIVDMLNIDILLTFSGYLFYWNFVSGQHTTAVWGSNAENSQHIFGLDWQRIFEFSRWRDLEQISIDMYLPGWSIMYWCIVYLIMNNKRRVSYTVIYKCFSEVKLRNQIYFAGPKVSKKY